MPQPFDQSFKLLSDDDPRATLALFTGIPVTANITVEPLDRELNLTTLRVDNLYRCRDEHSEFLIHIEVLSRFKHAAVHRQFDYALAIAAKYSIPCRSYLVLLTEKNAPKVFPKLLHRRIGDFHATLSLRIVRLWRTSAASILDLNNPQLLPWIPLLNASPAQLDQAFERLKSDPDHSLLTRLVILGGLRYGGREAFLQRLNQMILSDEILQDSSTYHLIVEQGLKRGLAKGLTEGRTEGRTEGLRSTLTKQLTHRFGPLPAAALKKLNTADPDKLDRWLDQILDAPTLKEALK